MYFYIVDDEKAVRSMLAQIIEDEDLERLQEKLRMVYL